MCPGTLVILAVLTSSLLSWSGRCRLQSLVGGQSLNDDRWHSLYIKRRANVIQLGVDNTVQSTGKLRIYVAELVVGPFS